MNLSESCALQVDAFSEAFDKAQKELAFLEGVTLPVEFEEQFGVQSERSRRKMRASGKSEEEIANALVEFDGVGVGNLTVDLALAVQSQQVKTTDDFIGFVNRFIIENQVPINEQLSIATDIMKDMPFMAFEPDSESLEAAFKKVANELTLPIMEKTRTSFLTLLEDAALTDDAIAMKAEIDNSFARAIARIKHHVEEKQPGVRSH